MNLNTHKRGTYMALFGKKKETFSFETIREGEDTTLTIDLEEYPSSPSLEDDPICMAKTIDILTKVRNATKIVLTQKRNYEYDYEQVSMLNEIASLIVHINKDIQIIQSKNALITQQCARWSAQWYSTIQDLLTNNIKKDPIATYVQATRILREQQITYQNSSDQKFKTCAQHYINILSTLVTKLQQTKLISRVQNDLAGFTIGDRTVYRKILTPDIRPDFIFTKLMAQVPHRGQELESYTLGESTVIRLFKLPDSVQYLYHMTPPEFKLSEDKYEILDSARNIVSEHKPTREEFVDPERMRQVFFNVGSDLIEELATYRGLKLSQQEIQELTSILVRYTVGFGLIELLLQDDRVQDITINSPMGATPIFIVHQDFGDCKTNIIPTNPESESWASKLRLISGRPLDEANPIMDTELSIPGANARVAVISKPLNPSGLAYALRRHRDKPWTLPLLISKRMLNPLAAGILSFIVDGSRTMLVAGTRSAGKTSLLGALLVEIMRKYRIITIEDTLELPTTALRKLGFNIQAMKVAAALTQGTSEVPADEGIRTTLRMGDSALIVGEIRSTEALALYEAMRVGALANVVAGTIHGDSPYGIYDRVVNDLKVPKTSFKATDIVIVANPVKSADGLHKWRRVTQISEVRKHWENDPLLENGFVDLMKYDSNTDELVPSSDLLNGDSDIIKSIAGNIKEWAGNWEAVWDNILLRAKIKETLVETATKQGKQELLEAEFTIMANDEFHNITEKVREDTGTLDSKRIFFEWNQWLKRTIKKQSFKQEQNN